MTFREVVEAKDLDALEGLLAEDVGLHSPVTFKPFEGRAVVVHVLRTVVEVFQDFRYVAEMERDDLTTLVFRARVGEREIDGIDLLRRRADGLIDDITVFVRPLSGLSALRDEMGARLGAPPS
ncbi:MAG: NADH:flavin oxidoreductase/nadh oxidase [Solirubrobacteraceae bacterium]|nr:NADH:flavin oxidoreductase/nadh oxidase [Solirubrobacteraceae bacterium]